MIESLYDIVKHWSCGGSVYIISDTHFDDPQCKEVDPDWPSPKEHIALIRKYVTPFDTLIHLGDVGNPEYMDQIPCYKVLVMGNHDRISDCASHFDEVFDGPLYISKKLLLSHEKVYAKGAVNIHGHHHCDKPGLIVDENRESATVNMASDVCRYIPMNLGTAIKQGLSSVVKDIHRITIDNARLRSE